MSLTGFLLAIDGASDSLQLIADNLTAEEYHVECASNCEAALALVAVAAPDLILLDIDQPEIGSFELFRKLKETEACHDVPVVLIGAVSKMDRLIEGLQLGAVDFITKPFKREVLLARVQNHLALSRMRARLKQQALSLQETNKQLQIEIEEHEQAEAALKENQEVFRRFMEHSPIYVFFKDAEIRAIRVSRNFEQLVGRPMEQILGKTMDDLFPSDFAKKMIADDKKVMADGKPIVIKEEFNGRFYITIKFPIYYDGVPRYLAGYTIDTTEQHEAEAVLKEKNAKLEEALANVKALSGLLPICSGCKKIRDDKGYWNQVEHYVQSHSGATFTHSLCPECMRQYFPQIDEKLPG